MELSAIDENEGKVVSASGHLFLIENGVRRWLSTPPDNYIGVDGISQVSRRKNGSL
tara:strand:+ start:158 stop:325 length:168 start_codon:yes stop_codon:yes gene_type:complete